MHRLASPDGPSVPVIIGTNLDEGRYWLYYISELDRLPLRFYRPWLESLVGERTDEVIADYQGERPELDEAQTGMALSGDVAFRMPAIRMAEALSDRGVPVWMYLATVTSPDLDGRHGVAARHRAALRLRQPRRGARPGTGRGRPPQPGPRRHRSRRLWVEFATTGVPAADGAPAWPQYDRTARTTLIIDREMSVQDDPYPAARITWGDDALRRLRSGARPADPAAVRGHQLERPL